ncbi:MAG: hypothetical protein P8O16_02350 [Algoriphagus sp.]|uniref:hypothetical protein n=1 Tax=Algoriphagus sp. TaxID=1872435 RepID=UPI002625B6BD|nr:hypothetical protein [Algoriphagus sp.]MDG1276093.1 hypothetical protein [Algoriphagus sp.]
MPKPHTFPTLYDEAFQISIAKLKEWGYLHPYLIKSGTITWSRNGNKTGSISIRVNTYKEEHYIELDYKYNDTPRTYKVRLVSIPSNLGKGVNWYFLCPETHKRCRKLYSIGGYFLHREAFKGCMYETQTQSKRQRQLGKTLGVYFKTDDLYSQLFQKHFKKTYAGKLTKRYLKLSKEIREAEKINFRDIEKLCF